MGLASSQARLLSLTSRLSDLELRAQTVSNSKIRLADASTEVSKNYQNALNAEKLTVMNKAADAYIDATANNLTAFNMTAGVQKILTDSAGTLWVSQDIAKAYEDSKNTVSNNNNVRTDAIENMDAFKKVAQALSAFGLIEILDALDGKDDKHPNLLNMYLDLELGYHDSASATQAGKTYDAKQVEYFTNLFNIVTSASPTATYSKASANTLQILYNSVDDYLASMNLDKNDPNYKAKIEYYTNIYTGKEAFLQSQGFTSNPSEKDFAEDTDGNGLVKNAAATQHYERLFEEMEKNGYRVIDNANLNDSKWLYNQLESGNIFIAEWKSGVNSDGSQGFEKISWTSGNAGLLVKSDNRSTAIAEAEYETEMSKIKSKDQRFDMELKQIDIEHNAVQTQMESVQKVINKNIERSFKIFEA